MYGRDYCPERFPWDMVCNEDCDAETQEECAYHAYSDKYSILDEDRSDLAGGL